MTAISGIFSTELIISDPAGLHMRSAASIVNTAKKYDADVSIEHNGKSVNGKSLLAICLLAAHTGARLTVSAVGRDARAAIRAMEGGFEGLSSPDVGQESPRRIRSVLSGRRAVALQ